MTKFLQNRKLFSFSSASALSHGMTKGASAISVQRSVSTFKLKSKRKKFTNVSRIEHETMVEAVFVFMGSKLAGLAWVEMNSKMYKFSG